MDKKKNTLGLIFIMILSACQQAPATPVPTPDELAPYYGTPKPAKVIINGKSYDSGVGDTKWIYIDSNGNQYMSVGDAFAIITPVQPVVVKSPFSLTLKLPIPINPTDLWYRLIAVTDKDRAHEPSDRDGSASWDPSSYPEQIFPSLLYQQELIFPPTPGTYVLEVCAGWGGTKQQVELRTVYGFLFEVQE
jgi:hypothetical protein